MTSTHRTRTALDNAATRNAPGAPTVKAEDLKVGDIVVFFGHRVSIGHIDPPKATDPDFVIGRAYRPDRQWGITLTAGARFEVDRPVLELQSVAAPSSLF